MSLLLDAVDIEMQIVTHSGGIPGITTNVFILPADDLGVVVLANADAMHIQEHTIIYRLIEDYLGLQRTHSARLRKMLEDEATNKVVQNTRAAQTSTSAGPPLPLDAYAGTYVDPGYPVMTLCSGESTSSACRDALDKFAHFENVTTPDTLYAIVPGTWISHARVKHSKDNTFYLTGTYLFPNGYGKDTSAFETWEDGTEEATLEFVTEDDLTGGAPTVIGVGVRGMVGETTNLERIGGTVEETAEVYFRKV